MIPSPDDTIVALASTSGPGARGIVRLSGPSAASVVSAVFAEVPHPLPKRRALIGGSIRLSGLFSTLPADLYYSPPPRTYTGQETTELHLVSCPPILDALMAALLNAGARAAQPGEFTLRAFLNGKKDLAQAEAVGAVVEAGSTDELNQALNQLAGGVTQPLQSLRDDLLNLLADVEAGLDFAEEDIQFVNKTDMLLRISKGLAQLTNLRKQLDTRSLSTRPFRVALIGPPNAGKSSLFNALAGLPAAIVSPVPGTTRDYLTRSVMLDDREIELIDTAGRMEANDSIENQAQALGRSAAQGADLLLWCAGAGDRPAEPIAPNALRIATMIDLNPSKKDEALATSARTGQGIAELKSELAERARAFARPAMASSLSRCQHHVDAAIKHLRAAHGIVLFDDAAELLALELRLALEQIGQMTGAIYTEDLLDRIFSRFCIGK